MLFWQVATAFALAAECPEPVKAEQVGGHVEDAMLAYATLDEDGFRASAGEATESLPCVEDVFSPARAAGYHRMRGLLSFIDGDPTNAQKSFAAALAIEPDYALSAKIAPEGGKLWRSYDGARVLTLSSPASFPSPRGATAYVDGKATTARIAELPAIVQVIEGTKATTTVYVASGSPVPELVSTGAVAVIDEPLDPIDEPLDPVDKEPKEPKEPKEGGSGGPKLMIGAGASLGVAAALFGTAAVSRTAFDKNPSAGTYYVTNGAYYGSIGAAALGIGLGVVGVSGRF